MGRLMRGMGLLLASLSAAPVAWGAGPAAGTGQRIPAAIFSSEPRGMYQTGTVEELWVDQQRGEDTTADPNDKRHLMVQVWYPARSAEGARRAPYVLRREIYPIEGWLNDVRGVITNSVVRATLADRPARFPVLIYNPGGNSPHFSGTFQTEFLASHGYVVVAIGRPDNFGPVGSGYYPDGYVYRRTVADDLPFYRNGDGSSPAAQLERERWMADMRFVLDRLHSIDAAQGSRFHGRLDLERVGALGWSAGGLLSLRAGSEDPRIKAAVNLDNPITAYPVPAKVRTPVLVLHQDVRRQRESLISSCVQMDAVQRERWANLPALFTQFYARSDSAWYDATIEGATHEHFSDRVLFKPADPAHIHPRLAHEIINRFTLEFFDRHLRQDPYTPLLSRRTAYPAVDLFTSDRETGGNP